MTARQKKAVTVITDGGCRGNPGPGAWAAILVYGSKRKELSGYEAETTNNRMELTAAIQALTALKEPCRVEMVTDSQYLRKGMTEWLPAWVARGWRTASKKRVLNQDLWQRLAELAARHELTWTWVRGHSGHNDNERCDQIVNQIMDRHAG